MPRREPTIHRRGSLRLTPDLRTAATVFVVLAGVFALARTLMWGEPGTAFGFASDLAFAATIATLVSLPPKRGSVISATAVVALLSSAMLVAVTYAAYFQAVPTLDMLGLLGQGAEMTDNIADLWSPWNWALVAAPLLVLLMGFRRVARKTVPAWLLGGSWIVLVGVVALATISLVRVQGPVDSIIASRSRGIVAYQFAALLREKRQAKPMTDRARRVTDESSATVDPLNREVDDILGRRDAQRIVSFPRGTAKGRSVIVVQFEALQTHVIGLHIGGREVTPNLNRLMQRSHYFPNGVSQIAKGNTSDAEWAANTSLYPSMQKASSLQWWDKEVPALPRLLAERGYATVTMHPNKANFWNRRQLYAALGFEKFYDREFFGEGDGAFDTPGDTGLYEEGVPVLERLRAAKRPFYGMLVTISSHGPFKHNARWAKAMPLPAEYEDTELGNYLQSIHAADAEFGQLLERLEANGMIDECVVVVYGDHSGPRDVTKEGAGQAEVEFAGRPYTSMDMLSVPVMISVPGHRGPFVNTDPVAAIDVMPTIADLLGVDLSAVPHFGRSAFERGRVLIGQRRYVPEGSYVVREGLVQLTGLGLDGAQGFPVNGSTEAVPVRPQDYEDALRLVELSDAYTNSLPARPGAVQDADMKIPTPAGRGE